VVVQIRRAGRTRASCCGPTGFAREALMAWCEANRVDYLFGLARNTRLVAEIEVELAAAEHESRGERPAGAALQGLPWTTRDSWSRRRRCRQGRMDRRRRQPALRRDLVEAARGRRPPPLRADLLRPRRDGEPHQGVPARPVRRPHLDAATMRANQLDLMRPVSAVRRFHASQQASMISPVVCSKRSDRNRSRR
jgi:hypothetical protein